MIRHILILTFRKFNRHRTSFLINLTGLSTGLTCVLLIFLWLSDELSVDKFHEKDDQLYEILQHFEFPDRIQTRSGVPALLGEELVTEMPEVEEAARMSIPGILYPGVLNAGDQNVVTGGEFASSNFFQVFSYELLAGDRKEVLSHPNNIVLSKELAIQLFQSPTEAMGKTVTWSNNWFDQSQLTVSGVFDNPSTNPEHQFNALVSIERMIDGDRDNIAVWSDGYTRTYLVLREDTDIAAFDTKVAHYLLGKHSTWDIVTLSIRKFSDGYLYNQYEAGELIGGRIEYVRLFSFIGLVILLIACINFMNLSTAEASRKTKEIGVKKTIGGRRIDLVYQFLTESMLLVALSFLLALVWSSLLLPQFNLITGKELQLYCSPNLLLYGSIILVVTGLLAGSYPAFYLSSFAPLSILRGRLRTSHGEVKVRKGLVVFQFMLTTLFIIGVLVINRQMAYTQSKHLGYERDQILQFQRPIFANNTETLLSEVKSISGVEAASNMARTITSGGDDQMGYSWRGKATDEDFIFKAPQINYDVIETLGMEMVAGRSFSRELKDDGSKIILNETALKHMQLEDPIGKVIEKDVGNGREKREIIGVVKDFHYGSIHEEVKPLIFRMRPFGSNIMVRIRAGSERAVIAQLENLFQELYPAYPFVYSFLDEDYERLYEAENKVAILSRYFSALAIIISCLGLFGLAMFTAERRRKEIGIRKVLGASVLGIVRLLTQDFTKTVLLGIVLSLPIAYWAVGRWLDNFAYNIGLDWRYFVLPGLLVLIMSWLTVGLQTINAARVNPVNSLKDE